MKKVLTVLLAIAVVFTFSFGSTVAFADSDDAKAYVADNQAKYYEKIDDAAKAVNFTYDEDGYLAKIDGIQVDPVGYVTKALVDQKWAEAVDAAKVVLNEKIGKIDYSTTNTTALAITALDNALTAAKAKLAIGDADMLDMLEKQLKADKEDASALFAKYDSANYSSSSKDWSLAVAGGSYFDEGSKNLYETTTVTGLAAATYPAKTIVKGLLDTQNQVVVDAAGTDKDSYKNAIDDVREAKTTVKDILDGHKEGTGDAAYYIKAIPTINDLKDDTSLADKKANAIAVVTAKLSAAQVKMADELQEQIDALDKKAKLDKDETKKLNKLKSLKASLADDFANIKEVYTAQINNAETTNAVDTKKDTLGSAADNFTAGTVTADGYPTGATKTAINNCADYVKWVKDLKADAEVLKSLKNVNGEAYYDAEQLADSLADAIEDVYNGSCTAYADAYDKLTKGNDAALINAKILYTKVVKGDTVGSLTGVEDSDGNTLTAVWNKSTAKENLDSAREVAALGSYVADPSGSVAVYDKAQKAELKALVDETVKAIENAKTVAEVKSIFKAANDKYADIKTKADHFADWTTGKLKSAYDKEDYDKELTAYATYFASKANSDYPTMAANKILTDVVYPIVYEAYTVDELAGKVAEAKAAVDAIKTKDQLKAEKAAVETLIKDLPATNVVALTDKDAIVKAADALDDYNDLFGSTTYQVTNTAKLDAVKEAYEKLDADAIKDAYDALDVNNVTVNDEAAIKALRDAFDAHEDFCADYAVSSTITSPTDENVEALEDALSAAKVNNVKKLMAQLPANPTEKDRAQVEAAKAAYDALTLAEKSQLVGNPYYNAMIDAIEALGLNVGTNVKELQVTASSTAKKGSITVKWTVKGDATGIDGFEVWKSTKHSKGYKKAFTTAKQSYKNSKGLKKGTRYYYKVRAYKMVDGKKITSDWSNKARRVAK